MIHGMDFSLGQFLRDGAELIHVRLMAARDRRSRASQQRYADGYRAAFENLGRRPRSDIAPHPQVEVDGIEVDAGMARLLSALWSLGFKTQFSCEGDSDRYIPREPAAESQWCSQIVFTDVDQAVAFLERSLELLGHVPWENGAGRFYLAPMTPLENGSPRAEVTFPPSLLPELTDAWVATSITR